jgi:hypothetical protein
MMKATRYGQARGTRSPRGASTAERLRAIRKGLAALAVGDRMLRLFGAGAHGYELNPKLPAESAAMFEERFGIELPSDYRAFLVQLGNGGAGPFYGVFRLGEFFGLKGHASWEGSELVGTPALSFPYAEGGAAPSAPRSVRGNEEEVKEAPSAAKVDGSLPICEEGFGLRDWLVVSGPEAGHVWHDKTAEGGGFLPWNRTSDGAPMSFLDWYEAWLEASLAGETFAWTQSR